MNNFEPDLPQPSEVRGVQFTCFVLKIQMQIYQMPDDGMIHVLDVAHSCLERNNISRSPTANVDHDGNSK